ncbi:MAG: MarR family transcriptional regulator [Acidimicrobiia bacterium]|jgi:DNA-binding MarR family transcriptional regulator
MIEDTLRTRAEIAAELRLTVGRICRRLRQQNLGGLTPSQRSVLATLDTEGPLQMGTLAAVEAVAPPSMTGIVSRLEERGLVRRSPDPGDARAVRVEATEEAKLLLAALRSERNAFLMHRLADYPDDEIATIAAALPLLRRLTEAG